MKGSCITRPSALSDDAIKTVFFRGILDSYLLNLMGFGGISYIMLNSICDLCNSKSRGRAQNCKGIRDTFSRITK